MCFITEATSDFVFSFLEPKKINGISYLLITTSSFSPVPVSVSIPGISFVNETVVWRETLANISLPEDVYLRGIGKQDKAVIVHSEAQIFVHAVYSYRKYYATGFSILPTSLLGMKYFVSSYPPDDTQRSEFSVTALDTFTTVDIYESGGHFKITLSPYESYQMRSINDVTGTEIVADKPVSVMAGSSASYVNYSDGSSEYLIQHIPPVNQLGTSYVLAPFLVRPSGYVFRIIATEPETVVNITGLTELVSISQGRFYEMEAETMKAIIANKPVLVAQYSKSHHTDTFGDAFMLIIPPIKAAPKEDITFPVTTLTQSAALTSYLSITIACDHLSSLSVDGITVYAEQWNILQVTAGEMLYCVLRRNFDHGVHHIITPGRNVPFEAIVYGFSTHVAYTFTLWGLPLEVNQDQDTSLFEGEV